MKILITGGAGFIGYNYAKHRLERGDEVHIIDNLSRRGSLERADILIDAGAYIYNRQFFGYDRRFDIVFHLAAQTAVTRSFENPMLDFNSNASATLTLLESIRSLGPPFPKFIYASTNKVYGPFCREASLDDPQTGCNTGTICEEIQLDLRTPYGISKGAADLYCQEYGRSFGIPTIILRQSCIYGPYQTAESDQGWVMHFTSSILQRKQITIFGDGRQIRDILHINDLIDLYDRLLENKPTPGVVYNVGGGGENAVTILRAVDILAAVSGKNSLITYAPRRTDDQDYYVSDITKIGQATGWKPEIGATEGLRMLVEWVKDNPGWAA